MLETILVHVCMMFSYFESTNMTLGVIHKQRLLKGGGRGGQKCRNLLGKKTTKGEGGVIKSEKWADVVYGWPLR